MKLDPTLKQQLKDYLKKALAQKAQAGVIVAACPLTKEQVSEIVAKIPLLAGKTVTVEVDPSLMAGFVVRVGSKMIDYSLRTKIKTLFIH